MIAGQPSVVAGDLDQQVGPVDGLPELLAASATVAVGVVGEAGGDLDRDPAVDAVGGVVDRPQHVAGVADVVGGDHPRPPGRVGAVGGELADLRVVPLTLGAAPTAKIVGLVVTPTTWRVLDEVGEVAGLEALAGQVVEPDGDSRVGRAAASGRS